MTAGRPEQFLALLREQQLGRLKVYLGFAPGVGKTYEMLQEAHRLKKLGVDVVIGVVETHGRPDTAAQVGDLEQVPPRRVEYRGVGLAEMDLDAVVARRPAVVLVDELAHTNAPGSRFAKRYQDVEELLRQGVSVITALNVQHLESLHDVVGRFAGVPVRERVPDYVLARAHQIVNVDLPAEDLQERLAAGKVYPPERAERALAEFFTAPNLTRLRELALEEVAHRLDRQRAVDGRPAGSDRVLVLISSRSPVGPEAAPQGGPPRRPAASAVGGGVCADPGRAGRAGGRRHPAAGGRGAVAGPPTRRGAGGVEGNRPGDGRRRPRPADGGDACATRPERAGLAGPPAPPTPRSTSCWPPCPKWT